MEENQGLINLSTDTDYVVLDKSNLKYQIFVSVDNERQLQLFFRTRQSKAERSFVLHGTEHLQKALQHLDGQFDTICAEWVPAFGDNLDAFNEAVAAGASKEEAALTATWTGPRAADAGYSKVSISSVTPEEPPFTNVEVRFSRPRSRRHDKDASDSSREGEAHAGIIPDLTSDESELLNTFYNLLTDHLVKIQENLSSPSLLSDVHQFQQPSLFWLNEDAIAVALLANEIKDVKNALEAASKGQETAKLSQHTQRAVRDMKEIVRDVENKLANAMSSLVRLSWNQLSARKFEYSIRASHQATLRQVVSYEALAGQLLLDGPSEAPGTSAAARPNVTKQETDTLRERISSVSDEFRYRILEWCTELPGMSMQRLATIEASSSGELIGAELDGFVSRECLEELLATSNRIRALCDRVRNIEPTKGLPRRQGRLTT
jgi:hypothetical protein